MTTFPTVEPEYLYSRRSILGLGGLALVVSACPSLAAAGPDKVDPTVLFNRIRAAQGLPLMATDAKLEKAALYQARRMASHGKMGHSIGWGNGFSSRLKQAGIRGAAAENVAAGQRTTTAVFEAWMKSPGHRRNMLDPDFSHYGLAWAAPENKPGYIYWAMVLGA